MQQAGLVGGCTGPTATTHTRTHTHPYTRTHTADLVLFGKTMGPLAVAYVCKNTCYLVLQTAAAGLDTIRLAAHQV